MTARDRGVAIVGVGTTPYERLGTRSQAQLAADACRLALGDAGLEAADVDGMCGSRNQVTPQHLQQSLGIPVLTWWSTPPIPFSLLLGEAVNALRAGACQAAVVYQAQFRRRPRHPVESDWARVDQGGGTPRPDHQFYAPYGGRGAGYAGYMRRYIHEFGATREHFGLVAMNGRSNAAANEHAALRDPLTMQDYLGARMVSEPMCLLDIEYAVDGGDAVVLTTADRARDLKRVPVHVDAIAYGQREQAHEDLYRDLDTIGQTVAASRLWSLTDLRAQDFDIVHVYDGFTIIALKWLESFGFCGPGQAGPFLRSCWSTVNDRFELGGRVIVNSHGGSLSEGATQGAGHIREAVVQLRGEAGTRQVTGARSALLGIGGLFTNSTAIVLTSG